MDNVVPIESKKKIPTEADKIVDKKLNEQQEKQFRAHLDNFTMMWVKLSTLQQIDFLFNLSTRVDLLQMDIVELKKELDKLKKS